MSEIIARDQIRSLVDRILRLKEEAKGINDDIREVYAEAKGNGFDKTQLGRLVTYIDKRRTDSAKVEEADAIFDLYLSAYDGTKVATHAHAGEAKPPQPPNRTSEPLSPKGGDEGLSPPASGGDDKAGLVSEDRKAETASRSAPAGSASDEIPVTAAPMGVSSQTPTEPEARMPRVSSPVTTGKKGDRLPVPGAENNRYARGGGEFIQKDIPKFLRRDGKKAEAAPSV